jgi:hypothetical protein
MVCDDRSRDDVFRESNWILRDCVIHVSLMPIDFDA